MPITDPTPEEIRALAKAAGMEVPAFVGLLGGPLGIAFSAAGLLKGLFGGKDAYIPPNPTGPYSGPYPSVGSYRGVNTGISGSGSIAGTDLGGGYVMTDRGLMGPDGTIISTPPFASIPTVDTASGGSSSASGGGGSTGGMSGGQDGTVSLEVDPSLVAGDYPDWGPKKPAVTSPVGDSAPKTGSMPNPEYVDYVKKNYPDWDWMRNPNGPPVPNSIPPMVPEAGNKLVKPTDNLGWLAVIADWVARFPDATKEQQRQAATDAGMPADVINQVLGPGTNTTANNTSNNTGGNTGTSGSGNNGNGSTGPASNTSTTVTGNNNTLPTPPAPTPYPPSTTGPAQGSSNNTATNNNTTITGMFSAVSPTRTTETVFPELYKWQTPEFTLLGPLISYMPKGMFR